MSRLVWKIFLPVSLAMAGLILISLILIGSYSARAAQNTFQQVPQLYEESKDALLESGRSGLVAWLEINKNSMKATRIFIIDKDGKDILNRDLPLEHEVIHGRNSGLRGNADRSPRGEFRRNDPPRDELNSDKLERISSITERRQRRSGRYPVLRTESGERYRFQLARPAGGFLGMLKSQSMLMPIFLSMILLSALVSALIARKISQPIQRLRQGTQSFASGNLSERVSADFVNRKDEIGDLAREFDDMAEKISNLVDSQQNLLRDVSHELRSPLARLQVALGLAEKRSSDNLKPELARIETEANTLNEMIGKILSLVRLNNLSIDNTSLTWEETDLVTMLNKLVANANYEAQEKSVQVNLQSPESLNIKAVPNLLSSAIENVLRNAVKHTPENSEISCVLSQSENGLSLTISDMGEGVPEAELEKIFEPFYRVSQVREHQQGGGGIGLAIAKQAVELHGGRIWAENTNQGLQVNIEI